MNNYFQYLAMAMQIATQLMEAETELTTGVPVNVPAIRTYLGKQHIEVDITIKPLAD